MNMCFRNALRRCAGAGLALVLSLSLCAAAYAAEVPTEAPREEVPVSAPEEVPVSAPEEAPVSAPEEVPVSAPEEAPGSAPEEVPVSAPEEVPVTSPEAVPDAAEEEDTDVSGGMEEHTILIGDTSFSAGEEESSHWSDGRGWKNMAGQYVAMVDYDGSETEISADGGTLTLAVAGVNRIGKLKGSCSFNIVGTGIVLIDGIEIDEGQTVSLMPDISLYEEGSAAVFLKQENGEYLLINGNVPAILDEEYSLEDVVLAVPEGSSVELGCVTAWTEIWTPDGSDGPASEVRRSATTTTPVPVHEGGQITDRKDSAARLVLGNSSSLSVDRGALVRLDRIGIAVDSVAASLLVQGALTLKGIIEGGLVNISDGGSLEGDGTVRNAEITLEQSGNLSENIHIDHSTLTVKGGERNISTQLDNSRLYLGSGVTVKELYVSGDSLIGFDNGSEIGNITLGTGSHLDLRTSGFQDEQPHPMLYDRILTISGRIAGGMVSVLSGCVLFTGETGILPSVPEGYAARVYVTGADTGSTGLPLTITEKDAAVWVQDGQIPVILLSVTETGLPDATRTGTWAIDSAKVLEPLTREEDQSFTCASFLERYGLKEKVFKKQPGLEVFLYSQSRGFERLLLWADDTTSFSTEDVYMIRVLDAAGHWEQGGSASTHTDTSFTGSGVLGGSGAGSVQSGSGKVIFVKAASADPGPEDSGDGNNETGTKEDRTGETARTTRNEQRKAAGPGDGTDSLTVTVVLREVKGGDSGGTSAELPQIYTLSVTKAGVPAPDLAGAAVSVTFPFEPPAAWGETGMTAGNRLYAVFADEEGVLTACEAEYDPETGEISFETDRSGEFVIVRFAYTEEPFTEEFYRALSELEEVREFLAILREG